MTTPVRIWGQRDFMWLLNHENRSSSVQDMSQTNLVPLCLLSWAPWAPGTIFSTTLKVVPMSLTKMFHVNPVETFCKIEGKWLLTFLGYIEGWKDPKIWPLGTNILQTSQSSSSELKTLVSCECNGTFYKKDKTLPFGLNLGPIRGQKGPIM